MGSWKEVIAFISSLVALVAAIEAISNRIDIVFRWPLVLVPVVSVCLYLISRKVPSLILDDGLRPFYPNIITAPARLLLSVSGVVMIVWAPIACYVIQSPEVESVIPANPAVNERVTIKGKHFQFGRNHSKVLFRDALMHTVEASVFYSARPDALEVQVPPNAGPGPLVVQNSGTLWNYSSDLVYVDVKSPELLLRTVGEEISIKDDRIVALFSLRNTSDRDTLIIYDIVIYNLGCRDNAAHSGEVPRMQLSGIARFGEQASQEVLLSGGQGRHQIVQSVFDKGSTVSMSRGAVESFKLILTPGIAPLGATCAFTIASKYHGSNGRRQLSYSDRLYTASMSDSRFSSASAIKWEDAQERYRAAILTLQKQSYE